MSKNVAVFVDVANIFYAAKAAGVDIDYVTLLKSATAGRDFVRAYAYTGLDPDNENQRQFHSFLSRSGYKVVSKDIRKYGDGRIKANLDIELVVDMMRMAQHIDIAVIVSGDGDFAPAIRAVQQMGVRAEVISFRGNTSSDLIDVADVFTDITQIARVEKGARSGRRVAAEGDLSMTEVPDKETEGGTRRRRARRGERLDEQPDRPEVAARPAADVGLPGNLIVLPGERLSRVGADGERELELEPDETPAEAAPAAMAADGGDLDAEGRRRRRRRGGRGRGRGRQGEAEPNGMVPSRPGIEAAAGELIVDDEEFLDEEIAPLPQHSTFGSVWDSQLGVTPAAPLAASSPRLPTDEDEDFEDEPEIPEYLLAERRQQQRGRGRPMRAGQGGGGRRAGYQSAMDRERYGRPAGTTGGASGFGGGGQRMDRPRPPLGGGGGRPPMGGGRNNRPPQARPSRPPYQEIQREREPERQSASSEPWSEVPADVQELLRAELARRQSSFQQPRVAEPAPPFREPVSEAAPETTAPARGRGRSARSSESTVAPAEPAAVAESSSAPARRGRRPAGSSAAPSEAMPSGGAEVGAEAAAATPAPARARRARSAPAEASAAAPAAPETATAAEAAPKARRTTRAKAGAEGAAASTPSEAPAAPRRRTTRKPTAEPTTEE